MRPRRPVRGYAALGALMVVVAVTAVATVGLSARTRDLGFEARRQRRAQARWAAEAGLAHARARRARGQAVVVQGTLPKHLVCDRIDYRVTGTASRLEVEGRCLREGRAEIRHRLQVGLRGSGRGTVTEWREP